MNDLCNKFELEDAIQTNNKLKNLLLNGAKTILFTKDEFKIAQVKNVEKSQKSPLCITYSEFINTFNNDKILLRFNQGLEIVNSGSIYLFIPITLFGCLFEKNADNTGEFYATFLLGIGKIFYTYPIKISKGINDLINTEHAASLEEPLLRLLGHPHHKIEKPHDQIIMTPTTSQLCLEYYFEGFIASLLLTFFEVIKQKNSCYK